MSRIIKSLAITILTCSALFTLGQSKTDEELKSIILGKWQFSSLRYVANKKATKQEKAKAEESFVHPYSADIKYIFKENGVFEQVQDYGGFTGSWKIENGLLTITNEMEPNAKPASVTIEENNLTLTTQISAGLSSVLVVWRPN